MLQKLANVSKNWTLCAMDFCRHPSFMQAAMKDNVGKREGNTVCQK